jgi:hypothetical protein
MGITLEVRNRTHRKVILDRGYIIMEHISNNSPMLILKRGHAVA